MIGVFARELFGHWIDEEEPPKEQPKSKVDQRNFLNEPGVLKQLIDFMKDVKTVEKKEASKTAQKKKK